MARYPNIIVEKPIGQNLHDLTRRCIEAAMVAELPQKERQAFILDIGQEQSWDAALETARRWFVIREIAH